MTDPLASIDAEAEKVTAPASGGLLSDRLKLLILPNPATPGQYTGQPLAAGVNAVLGVGAAEAQFGESAALCVDVLFPGGSGIGVPPLGWLAWNGLKMLRIKAAGAQRQSEQAPPRA